MLRYFLTVFTVFVFIIPAIAADTDNQDSENNWEIAIDISMSHSQSSYSDNWDGDENGNWTWIANLNALAAKQLSHRWNSRSTLKLEYGQTQIQERMSESWSKPGKSADKIDLESVMRYTTHAFLDPYAAFRFQSLFTDDRVDPVDYLNPIILTESAGIARTFIKGEKRELISRLGLSVHQKMDKNYPKPLTETKEVESKTITDAGIELVTELRYPLFKDNIKLSSKLLLFQALHNSEAEDLEGLENENDWKELDIDLETAFVANITKFIMVNLNMQWIYDKEIDAAGRFRELISVGLTYTII